MSGMQWHAKVANHRDANGLMDVTRLDGELMGRLSAQLWAV